MQIYNFSKCPYYKDGVIMEAKYKSITQEEFTDLFKITDMDFYKDLKQTLLNNGTRYKSGKFLYFIIYGGSEKANMARFNSDNNLSYRYIVTEGIGTQELDQLFNDGLGSSPKVDLSPQLSFSIIQLLQNYGGLKYRVSQYVEDKGNFVKVNKSKYTYEYIKKHGKQVSKDRYVYIETNKKIDNLYGKTEGIVVPISLSCIGMTKDEIYEIYKKAKGNLDTTSLKKIDNSNKILDEAENGPFYIAYCSEVGHYGDSFSVEVFGSNNKFYSENDLLNFFSYKTREEAENVKKAYKLKDGENFVGGKLKYVVVNKSQLAQLFAKDDYHIKPQKRFI